MTTQAVSGLSGGLYIGANKVAEITNGKLVVNGKTMDCTSGDSAGWDECIMGRRNWQINADFNLIVGDTNGFLALQAAMFAGNSVASVKMRSTAAGYNWSGTVLITQEQLTLFDLNNPQKVSWTLQGTSAITPAAS